MRLRTTSRTRPIRPAAPEATLPERSSLPTAPAPRRRRRISRRALVVAALVAAALAGIAATVFLTMPRMEPVGPTTLTNDATPLVQLRIAHPSGVPVERVQVEVGGERVDTDRIRLEAGGERVFVRIPRLADGEHRISVLVRDVGILRRDLRAAWTLEVDTTPPTSRIVEPVGATEAGTYVAAGVAQVTKLPLRLTVAAEAGSTLAVETDARGGEPVTADAAKDTRRTLEVPLPQGAQTLTVTATDRAGNVTGRTLRVLVDTVGPALTVRAPRVIRDATLALPIAARDPHGVELRVLLDGNELEGALREVAVTPPPGRAAAPATPTDSPDPAPGGDDADADTDALDTDGPIAGRWTLTLDEGAYEGRHVLEVLATDSLGTRTITKRTLLVDSSEDLGTVTGLRPGARGRDVAQLHRALLEQEVVPRAKLAADIASRSYGAQTRAAVQAFQQSRGMEVDGVAGTDTIAGLTLKIVIDRGSNTLTLYRNGAAVKTYRVATGAAEFPTPAGDFEIQTMEKNPTWTPPDSDWAKDAKVTPPGPDNPLGTRWMAIDGTVGIHGTNNPASLGYSVSHGCIRMSIPDVEELFDIVALGTPVTVV